MIFGGIAAVYKLSKIVLKIVGFANYKVKYLSPKEFEYKESMVRPDLQFGK